ncbi:phosphogluconate dehydrogenase (NAD(+)-dependent, decarboxylating) [Bacillus sp. AFS041924]|uniref:phosphogluconate dehydrogenase (NAD(+)-dependent, decarboxylating) n=1 Tax=Bacillus sp. AFS041924 TaxID=2033503 RepID=UPI000BFD200C|nr:decarboxylating 6-phosphogluconate dehydrogenase [Bacillus sp. AFS041924]PGS55836.1 6-phosphogluconate dehydrogenase (decarboxylating) [Bacillus sp. AFS041924]
MNIGIVGLGKMGFALAEHMHEDGHQVTAFDVNKEFVNRAEEKGIIPSASLEDFVLKMSSPRIIWIMVPAGEITDNVLETLFPLLENGDIILEGGNSHYKDSIRRAEKANSFGLHYLDVGTSGGIEGARYGACLMIGGDFEIFNRLEPLFEDLSVKNGYSYVGPVGSGHFLKMVHNGIEYGMMAAIGEGFEVLEKSEFNYDYEKVAKVWNNGSVIRSWLMELTQNAFSKDAKLDEIKGVMHSSGEGKWTIETALDLQVATPVIAMSLLMRYRSLEDDTFTGKVVAALRNEFGGHAVEKK